MGGVGSEVCWDAVKEVNLLQKLHLPVQLLAVRQIEVNTFIPFTSLYAPPFTGKNLGISEILISSALFTQAFSDVRKTWGYK